MTALQARAGALAGVAAAAVALGVAEIVAVLSGPRSAPLIAVGGVVVDAVPQALKQFAIDVFGVHDKTALLIGTAVLLAGFAALIGVAAARSWRYGAAGIAGFALIGVAAAVTRPGAGPAAALPALIGSAAGLLVLRRLLSGARTTTPAALDAAVPRPSLPAPATGRPSPPLPAPACPALPGLARRR